MLLPGGERDAPGPTRCVADQAPNGTLGGMQRDATHHQLGEFLRAQRELANLSIRQLARLAHVSDSYLSQVERGLHRPSAEVVKAVAMVLHLQPEPLYARLGLLEERSGGGRDVEEALRHDPRLTAGEEGRDAAPLPRARGRHRRQHAGLRLCLTHRAAA